MELTVRTYVNLQLMAGYVVNYVNVRIHHVITSMDAITFRVSTKTFYIESFVFLLFHKSLIIFLKKSNSSKFSGLKFLIMIIVYCKGVFLCVGK